ncbi:MAG: ATP-binding protein [Treponema sp.]|jgi:hypothetical protein|nr:ATP-binding protein [Treponema sp.]
MSDLTNIGEVRNSAAAGSSQMLLGYTEQEMEAKYFTSLEHIEKIIEYAEALGICDLLFEKAGSHIGILAERLSITPMQAVLFSLLFSRYNNCLSLEDMGKIFQCSAIKLLHYMNDLEELQKKKLVALRSGKENPAFMVPLDVVNVLRKKDVFVPESRENLCIDEFFGVLEDLFDQLGDEELSSDGLYGEVMNMVEANMQLLFCQKLSSYKFSRDVTVLLLCFCHLYVNNHDDNIGFHDFEFLYDRKSKSRMVYREFRIGSHILIESKFIENTNDEGFVNRESFRLTDSTKKDLLAELNIAEVQARNKKNLLLWENLADKTLFYNEKEECAIAELTSLLQDGNFREIQERLAAGEMRRGFACLFSGSPGTGKTETVYQIARNTKRNIMMVDISAIKGMYVGETEKQMKAVFDNYHRAVAAAGIAPILFFNEADAIIGKRIEFTNSSRAVDRMENTMQNIILQELENLDGILIATTNLTANMDKAFERRFLYRIEFEKPNFAVRVSIWRMMLPDLSAGEAENLAGRFEISGGQIENIARKYTVNMVLRGARPSPETLAGFCRDEMRGKNESGFKIGFSA